MGAKKAAKYVVVPFAFSGFLHSLAKADPFPDLEAFLHLLKNGRILQCGNILGNSLATGNCTQ